MHSHSGVTIPCACRWSIWPVFWWKWLSEHVTSPAAHEINTHYRTRVIFVLVGCHSEIKGGWAWNFLRVRNRLLTISTFPATELRENVTTYPTSLLRRCWHFNSQDEKPTNMRLMRNDYLLHWCSADYWVGIFVIMFEGPDENSLKKWNQGHKQLRNWKWWWYLMLFSRCPMCYATPWSQTDRVARTSGRRLRWNSSSICTPSHPEGTHLQLGQKPQVRSPIMTTRQMIDDLFGTWEAEL